jgi:hypothetical protein
MILEQVWECRKAAATAPNWLCVSLLIPASYDREAGNLRLSSCLHDGAVLALSFPEGVSPNGWGMANAVPH